MRVLGVLAAWGVLAVLATMCFALGGSIGYRRGVRDTLAQIRDRRVGKSGCRPLPANHMRRRSSGATRPGARARRSRWQVPVMTARHRRRRVLANPRVTALGATVTALVLLAVPVTAVGATTAQPGESLYGVKRGLEQVRLAFAFGPERDAKVHIDLAATRLGELAGLVGNDASSMMIADVSHDLEEHAATASARLDDAPDTPDRSQLQRRLSAVASQQVEVMDLALDGCADAGPECRALEQTHDETVALRDATTSDAPAVLAGEVSARPENPAQADAQASAAPSVPAVAAASVDDGTSSTLTTEPPPDATDPADPAAAGAEEGSDEGPTAEPPPDEGSAAEPPADEGSAAEPPPDEGSAAEPLADPSPSASSRPSESTSPGESTSPSESTSSGAGESRSTSQTSTSAVPSRPTPSSTLSPRAGLKAAGADQSASGTGTAAEGAGTDLTTDSAGSDRQR